MMNKGLELIEAHHLFGLPEDQIEILVHPQSVIHSAWSPIATARCWRSWARPDMRTPIAYALGWPNRIEAPSARLDFAKVAQFTFEAPDPVRFPALAPGARSLEGRGPRADHPQRRQRNRGGGLPGQADPFHGHRRPWSRRCWKSHAGGQA